eukprot:Stramenopile-MAST_4_protein_4296
MLHSPRPRPPECATSAGSVTQTGHPAARPSTTYDYTTTTVSMASKVELDPTTGGVAGDTQEEVFALEQVEFSEDESDEDFEYKTFSVGDDEDDLGDLGPEDTEPTVRADDEDLETALANIKAASSNLKGAVSTVSMQTAAVAKEHPRTSVRPAVVDDFIRNFLIARRMERTLDAFNTEWYEKQAKGQLQEEDAGVVPDIYLRNLELDEQVKALQVEAKKMRDVAEKAQGTWDKFRKERDFHRMHHKRVVQEKGKLVVDMKRLRNHYTAYEPTMKQLREKYEIAMKEKMLMRLERDRMSSKVEALEAHVSSLEQANQATKATSGGSQAEPAGGKIAGESPKGGRRVRKGQDTPMPTDEAVDNPYWGKEYEPNNAERAQLAKTFKGHNNAVASVAFHPRKQILATVSDDETWKLWSVPNGDLIMSGEGHKEWVSGVAFHPKGTHLATGSGDSTVKIWDFATASCAATLTDHTQPVWSVDYHHGGDFLVSSSMDHTAKLWDINSLRCRQTFRGHVDSINHVVFQPYTNNICTGSGDKTVSIWDIRSGLCVQTFYGHMNAVNHVAFNLNGSNIASCDADGVVKLWDVRMVAERMTLTGGQHSLNKITFDRSGKVLAAACDDGTIKVFRTDADEGAGGHVADLRGHEDAVQCVCFDPKGKFMVSGGSDSTFRVWALSQ